MIDAIHQIDGHESMTDQQIADTLRASGVTHQPINRADLVYLLNMRGMLTKIVSNNSEEKWTGTVLAMQDVIIASGDTKSIDAIRRWFSHITNVSNVSWDTRLPQHASPFWQMVQIFSDQTLMPTSEDFAAVAELGGGWRFADVTAEHVRSRIAAETLRSRVINATALFSERMTSDSDAAAVMAQAWEESI